MLDLLPDCVSAVYFLYHESIHWLNPGKLGALREIALAREEGYRWWYPGYYVHNCAKMRYKIEYKPQYVLDPEDLGWYLLDKEALALFDKGHYVCLSRKGVTGESASPSAQDGAVQESASHPPSPEAPPATSPEQPPNPQAEDQEEEEEEEEEEETTFLLTSSMPGIPTLAEMEALDMDNLVLRSDFAEGFVLASHLVVWESESVGQVGTLKSRVAELIAAVGPDLMGEVCIDFRKRVGG